jgi:hypothetical protein
MGIETHWEFFFSYMTSPAGQFDTILPSYLRRSICFESSLTGSGAIQNLLRQFTNVKPYFIEENKSLKIIVKKNKSKFGFISINLIKKLKKLKNF